MCPRHTDVLLFGQSVETWMQTKTMMKGALQSHHMGWSYISNPCNTLEDALKYVSERKELQIVAICDDIKRPRDQLIGNCVSLAQALVRHPEKPWVAITHDRLDYLGPFFELAGLTVVNNFNEDVIFMRWARHEVVHDHTPLGIQRYTCRTCESSLLRPVMMGDSEWIDFSETFRRYHPSVNGVRYETKAA